MFKLYKQEILVESIISILSEKDKECLAERYLNLINSLKNFGYNQKIHDSEKLYIIYSIYKNGIRIVKIIILYIKDSIIYFHSKSRKILLEQKDSIKNCINLLIHEDYRFTYSNLSYDKFSYNLSFTYTIYITSAIYTRNQEIINKILDHSLHDSDIQYGKLEMLMFFMEEKNFIEDIIEEKKFPKISSAYFIKIIDLIDIELYNISNNFIKFISRYCRKQNFLQYYYDYYILNKKSSNFMNNVKYLIINEKSNKMIKYLKIINYKLDRSIIRKHFISFSIIYNIIYSYSYSYTYSYSYSYTFINKNLHLFGIIRLFNYLFVIYYINLKLQISDLTNNILEFI